MKIKIIALFILIAMLTPLSLACGEDPAPAGSTGAADEPAGEETTPVPTPEPTTPAPTEPPPTEPPTEPFVLDESLSYWDQIYSELEWHGLSGGVPVFNMDEGESEVMRRFNTANARKEELDVSGDGVPFSAAYSLTIARDQPNFWDASYTCSFARDIEMEQDDLIVGVIWVRGVRLSETEQFMEDEAAQYYFAVKTPTDNWATEGQVSPGGIQLAEEEWQKVFFTARILNDEDRSHSVQMQLFLGYGNQQLDFGGIAAWVFPSTPDNERASMRITF